MNQGFGSGYNARDYGSTSSRQPLMNSSSDFDGFSPTEFISLKENIASNVVYIKSSWHQLEKAVKVVGTAKDNQEHRNRIHNVQTNTNSKVTETSKDLRRLSTLTRGGDKHQKLEVDRLTSEFKNIVEKYSKSQQIVAAKMKQVLLVNSAAMEQEQEEELNTSGRQSQLQAQRESQFEQEILEERHQRIRQIEADVLDVNQIFRDLHQLSQQQGEVVRNIGDVIDHTQLTVEAGREQIQKAAEHNAKYRKKVCYLIIIAVILGLIVTAIIVESIKS